MSEISEQFDENPIRSFAMIAAGILLNLGLFFILQILTPLVVGIVCGYILNKKGRGVLVAVISTAISYSLIFIVTGSTTDIILFGSAILLMVLIGAIGGFLGPIIHKHVISASN